MKELTNFDFQFLIVMNLYLLILMQVMQYIKFYLKKY